MFRTAYRLPFRLLGIPVDLDVSFLLIVPLLGWMIGRDLGNFILAVGLDVNPAPLTEGATPYALGVVAALGLFVSVLIHELGHAVVGRWFGLEIRRITLWILGGMAQFERIPRRRGREAIMAIAGPVTSYLLAVLAWLALGQLPRSLAGASFVVAYLFYMNVVLATFNLIPALPLDGGRVLRSLLALRLPYLRATLIAGATSKVLAVSLGLLGLVAGNLWLLLVALFIFMAVTGETQYATISAALRGIQVDDLMTRRVSTVWASTPVADLVERMFTERHLAFPVLEAGGELAGIVSLNDVRAMRMRGLDEGATSVRDIMSRDVATIGMHESALEAFQRINASSSGRLIVTGELGRMEGIISKTDLLRILEVRMVSGGGLS